MQVLRQPRLLTWMTIHVIGSVLLPGHNQVPFNVQPRAMLPRATQLHEYRMATGIVPRVVPPTDCLFSNISCSVINDLLSGVADLSFHTEYMRPATGIAFSPVVRNGYLIVVTGRGDQVSALLALLATAEREVWMVLAVVLLVMSAVWRQASRAPNPPFYVTLTKVLTLLAGAPSHKSYKISSYQQRVLICLCSMFSIIFAFTFQCELVEHMSSKNIGPEIETMKGLDDSGFKVAIIHEEYYRGFAGSDSGVLNRLNGKLIRRFDLYPDFIKTLEWVAETSGVATMLPEHVFDMFASVTHRGQDSLHEISEHPYQYFFAYPLPKGSPYEGKLREVIGWLAQAGLLDIWFDESMYALKTLHKNDSHTSNIEDGGRMDGKLYAYSSVFLYFIASQIVATSVFCIELIVGRKMILKCQNAERYIRLRTKYIINKLLH